VTPSGNVLIIDAVRAPKIIAILKALGFMSGERIDNLIITHPHDDHYSGVPKLLATYPIGKALLAPFEHYAGTPGYHSIVNELEARETPPTFLAGRMTLNLDGGFPSTAGPVAVVLGPANEVIAPLAAEMKLTPNHLSLMTKLSLGRFTMICAADAQMENWSCFDREKLMPNRCDVLKAAHHGSRHGTQCERLERLSPTYTLVSSDPNGRHALPDLIGAATFLIFSASGHMTALTRDTGTVRIDVQTDGHYSVYKYSEGAQDVLDLNKSHPLLPNATPTDWDALVRQRLDECD
jgi:beta-lactamase superfamily II metal-dependent hydrolase